MFLIHSFICSNYYRNSSSHSPYWKSKKSIFVHMPNWGIFLSGYKNFWINLSLNYYLTWKLSWRNSIFKTFQFWWRNNWEKLLQCWIIYSIDSTTAEKIIPRRAVLKFWIFLSKKIYTWNQFAEIAEQIQGSADFAARLSSEHGRFIALSYQSFLRVSSSFSREKKLWPLW